MKTSFVAIVFALTAVNAYAADQTWTGAISDKMCSGDHKAMGAASDRDCTLSCAKGGSRFVLVSGGKVYQLSSHETDLKTHAGHTVQLTGELKGDTIQVSKIEMPKK